VSQIDPPVVNVRKAIRDVISLHRRLSWIPESSEAKEHLIALKEALIAQYERLGGTWNV